MSSDDPARLRGIEMSDEEVADFLASQGHGTLTLADDGDAYGVPISFGYDGDRLFLTLLRFGEGSEKHEFLETTETACLVTYNVEDKFDWQSVVVRGELREVTDAEADAHEAAMDDNAWFPTIFPPTSPITEVTRYELRIADATGRKGEAHQPER